MVRRGAAGIFAIALAVVAAIGLGLALASFATHENLSGMMGRGMMQGTEPSSGPGLAEVSLLAVSAVLLVLAIGVVVTGDRGGRSGPVEPSRSPPETPMRPTPSPSPSGAPSPRLPEMTLVKLLDEDERRMYLEIRDHGGTMLQRDLVALGTFSKAKVTRLLDKLEVKGIVVRERHGMTNRVRIVVDVG